MPNKVAQQYHWLKSGLVIIIVLFLVSLGPGFTISPAIAQSTAEPEPVDQPNESLVKFTDETHDRGVDTDEDELFDFLIIELTVNVTEPGYYELGSKLHLGEEVPAIYVYREFEAERGLIKLKLRFDGERIFESGFSSNYICLLWLETLEGEVIDKIEYKTKFYEHTKFKHVPPPIILTENFEDSGMDTNDNRLYDFLSVRLVFEVKKPGYYLILGGLFKEIESTEKTDPNEPAKDDVPDNTKEPFYLLITISWKAIFLEEGRHAVRLNFRGPEIFLNKYSGPYHVGVWLEETDERFENPENVPREELERYKERLKDHIFWPMAGPSDLSGELIFETKYYESKEFDAPLKVVKILDRIIEYPIDINDNDLYDFLTLKVGVEVTEPGRYLIEGRIITENEWLNPWAENLTFMREGTHHVVLDFSGVDIHKTGLDGQYKIIIIVKGERPEGFPIIDRRAYVTKDKYIHKDFEPGFNPDNQIDPEDASKPFYWENPEGVTTQTDVLEVFTPRTRPELSFWYANSEDSESRFLLIFNRLIGYMDYNDNGRYDFGEEIYIAHLQESLWKINDITYSVNENYGDYIEFELSSEINLLNVELLNLEEPTKNQIDEREPLIENEPNIANSWGRCVFKFLITSNDFSASQPFNYEINGRTELKIDIDLEFYKPIRIDGITLEQILIDKSKSFGFKTIESTIENKYYPMDDDEEKGNFDVMNVFDPNTGENKQWIMFVDESGKEYGFYSWVNKINVTYYNGDSEIVEIDSTYTTDGTVLFLYTNYPYSTDISSIHHDPSVGMIEESKPAKKAVSSPIADILFNPIVYVPSAVFLFLILILAARSQTKPRKPRSTMKEPAKPPENPRYRPRAPPREYMKRY